MPAGDEKASNFTLITTIVGTDEVIMTDDVVGTPDNARISVTNFFKAIPVVAGFNTHVSVTGNTSLGGSHTALGDLHVEGTVANNLSANSGFITYVHGCAAGNGMALIKDNGDTTAADYVALWFRSSSTDAGYLNLYNGASAVGATLAGDGHLQMKERASDPSNPAEGVWVIWMSDGTGTGDDGDVIVKITAGGATKTHILVDFSAI